MNLMKIQNLWLFRSLFEFIFSVIYFYGNFGLKDFNWIQSGAIEEVVSFETTNPFENI